VIFIFGLAPEEVVGFPCSHDPAFVGIRTSNIYHLILKTQNFFTEDRFIETARQRMPATVWVGFQTNGHLLNRERAAALVEAGIDKVCISSSFHSIWCTGLFKCLQ
jgi:hypothetical protein